MIKNLPPRHLKYLDASLRQENNFTLFGVHGLLCMHASSTQQVTWAEQLWKNSNSLLANYNQAVAHIRQIAIEKSIEEMEDCLNSELAKSVLVPLIDYYPTKAPLSLPQQANLKLWCQGYLLGAKKLSPENLALIQPIITLTETNENIDTLYMQLPAIINKVYRNFAVANNDNLAKLRTNAKLAKIVPACFIGSASGD